MSITVRKQGWQHYSSQWNAVSGTYIGREDRSLYDMTEFQITPDKDYGSVTLQFAGSQTTGIAAKWSMDKPSAPSESGTAMTTRSSNEITVTGDFAAGEQFSIFVWSSISNYLVTRVGEASATGVEGGGLARVRHNGEFEKYEAKVYADGAWGRYVPYAFDNGEWRKMG